MHNPVSKTASLKWRVFHYSNLGKKHVRRFNLSETTWFCELKSLPGFGDCNVIGSFRQYIHKVIGSVLVIKFMFMFQICDFRQKNNFPFFHLILLVKIC